MFFFTFFAAYSIDDFGGIANDSSLEASTQNTNALTLGLSNTRMLIVPKYNNYFMIPSRYYNVSNQMLVVDGNISCKYYDQWPTNGSSHYDNFIVFHNATKFTLTGEGVVDGHGEKWWMMALENRLNQSRPNLVEFYEGRELYIKGLTFTNSPQYHILLTNVRNMTIDGIRVLVNTNLAFPLNTDGIDVSGVNITIENSIVKNFDDAIVMKPLNRRYSSFCTSNVVVRNITTLFQRWYERRFGESGQIH